MNSIKEFCLTKKETIDNNKIFIKEPVLDIIDKINESSSKKIILSGNFDSGKRLTSMEYMKEKIYEDELTFYFNSILLNEYQEALRENKIEAYIELSVALKLLSFIKNIGISISPMILKMDLYQHINRVKVNLLRNYKCGDLVCPLLYIIRKATGIKNVQLILNNIDGLPMNVQQKYSNYFDIFYKTILLINDNNIINDEEVRKGYLNKGYDLVNVDYAKDYEIARNIIDSRIAYHNKNNPKDELKFISKMINEEDFKMLIDSAEGNIRYILCAMKEFYLSNFKDNELVSNYIKNKANQCKNLKYRNLYPTKRLYL